MSFGSWRVSFSSDATPVSWVDEMPEGPQILGSSGDIGSQGTGRRSRLRLNFDVEDWERMTSVDPAAV